jgi:hypothetical protein
MTTLTITNIWDNFFTKKTYTVEELTGLLLKKMNYNIEIETFSEEENKILLSNSNWRYEEISSLID